MKRLVVKVGTSTLTYENGKMNIRRMSKLAEVLSDIANSGTEVVLVSSGAIGVGVQKLGLSEKPQSTKGQQAAASVGQSELMFIYDKLFGEYNQNISQLLLTSEDIDNEKRRANLLGTFEMLFEYGVIPIVNENDSTTTDEIEFGDNDTLSALTAKLVGADMLIILSDINGLYDKDPNRYPDAKILKKVAELTEAVYQMAGGAGSRMGTGGMKTKLDAARIATEAGIDVVIMNGSDPTDIYKVLDGEAVGTIFTGNSSQ
ncbi:MAG: glutamate 5-kinase [Ruminococcaceae bacterium]|nr:glutamate 5-kinase [Oscillospiraceae bacterium]